MKREVPMTESSIEVSSGCLDEVQVGKKVKSSSEHRASCHRCGNMRKTVLRCQVCPYIYCRPCTSKMIEEHGLDIFQGGCPVCKDRCCCGINKSNNCKRKYHCYKKCPITRTQSVHEICSSSDDDNQEKNKGMRRHSIPFTSHISTNNLYEENPSQDCMTFKKVTPRRKPKVISPRCTTHSDSYDKTQFDYTLQDFDFGQREYSYCSANMVDKEVQTNWSQSSSNFFDSDSPFIDGTLTLATGPYFTQQSFDYEFNKPPSLETFFNKHAFNNDPSISLNEICQDPLDQLKKVAHFFNNNNNNKEHKVIEKPTDCNLFDFCTDAMSTTQQDMIDDNISSLFSEEHNSSIERSIIMKNEDSQEYIDNLDAQGKQYDFSVAPSMDATLLDDFEESLMDTKDTSTWNIFSPNISKLVESDRCSADISAASKLYNSRDRDQESHILTVASTAHPQYGTECSSPKQHKNPASFFTNGSDYYLTPGRNSQNSSMTNHDNHINSESLLTTPSLDSFVYNSPCFPGTWSDCTTPRSILPTCSPLSSVALLLDTPPSGSGAEQTLLFSPCTSLAVATPCTVPSSKLMHHNEFTFSQSKARTINSPTPPTDGLTCDQDQSCHTVGANGSSSSLSEQEAALFSPSEWLVCVEDFML